MGLNPSKHSAAAQHLARPYTLYRRPTLPALPNRIQQKVRHQQIIQDYLLGLNYQQLSKKYSLDKSTISYILNKDDAKKITEKTYLKRVELLPKAIDIERDLLDSDNEGIKLKVIQKLYDDVGIGKADTPFALFQSIIIGQLDPAAKRFVESKAADISLLDVIDADFEEIDPGDGT